MIGAAARATTHSGQVCDSALLEWWCATTAAAVHTISSRHNSAAIFINERIPHNGFQYYTPLTGIAATISGGVSHRTVALACLDCSRGVALLD